MLRNMLSSMYFPIFLNCNKAQNQTNKLKRQNNVTPTNSWRLALVADAGLADRALVSML
jgi:hypothetical protein